MKKLLTLTGAFALALTVGAGNAFAAGQADFALAGGGGEAIYCGVNLDSKGEPWSLHVTATATSDGSFTITFNDGDSVTFFVPANDTVSTTQALGGVPGVTDGVVNEGPGIDNVVKITGSGGVNVMMASAQAIDGAVDPFDEEFGDGSGSGDAEPDNFCISCLSVDTGDSGCDAAGAGFPFLGEEPPAPGNSITVDNLSPDTVMTGTWQVSTGPAPFLGNSVYNNSGNTFRWFPQGVVPGDYEVFVYWTVHPNRSTTVPYRVFSSDAISGPFPFDQTVGGGVFTSVGVITFDGDGDEYVEVSSENGQASADAIRIVPE